MAVQMKPEQASGQELQDQVLDLRHRLEMMKVTMRLEVKDLGQQVETVRESLRRRLAEQGARLDAERGAVQRDFSELGERLDAIQQTSSFEHEELRRQIEDQIRRVRQAACEDLEEALEPMRQSARRDVEDLARSLEDQIAKVRECVWECEAPRVLICDLRRRLEVTQETTNQQVAGLAQGLETLQRTTVHHVSDLRQRLQQTRDTMTQEFAELGQRPIIQFLEAMLEKVRLQVAELGKQMSSMQDLLRQQPQAGRPAPGGSPTAGGVATLPWRPLGAAVTAGSGGDEDATPESIAPPSPPHASVEQVAERREASLRS